MAYRELGDFIVELDKAFDDDLAGAGPAAFLRIGPGRVDIGLGFERALALAGRTHDGLDHARQADLGDGGIKFCAAGGKSVGRGFQAEFFGGEAADALAVHGQARGARGGNDVVALAFQLDQGVGGDGLDLGHYIMWAALFR